MVDPKFFRKVEGFEHIAYVPMQTQKRKWKSGVTFANGIDIGQMSLEEFDALPLSEESARALRRFVGLKGEEAHHALLSYPPPALDCLELLAVESYILAKQEERIRERVRGWDNLPCNAQTVYMSLEHNFGPKGAPLTKGYIATRKYQAAIDELRNPRAWRDKQLQRRRNLEADLLEELV